MTGTSFHETPEPERPSEKKPVEIFDGVQLHHGDCVEVMAEMPSDSVDAVVTDPPYGLEFMGKDWDSVYTTEPTGWERYDDGKVGRWVLKNTHRGGPWPRTGDDVLAMKGEAR